MDYRGQVYCVIDVPDDCISLSTVQSILRDRKKGDNEPFWCEPIQWLSLVEQMRRLQMMFDPDPYQIAPRQIAILGIEISCREWRPDLFMQDGERFIPCLTSPVA